MVRAFDAHVEQGPLSRSATKPSDERGRGPISFRSIALIFHLVVLHSLAIPKINLSQRPRLSVVLRPGGNATQPRAVLFLAHVGALLP